MSPCTLDRPPCATCPVSGEHRHADDLALMSAVASNQPDACEELVSLYGHRMLAVARRMLRCDHDAADAVQDALVSAFKRASTYQGDAALSTWLHRVVVNARRMLRCDHDAADAVQDALVSAFKRASTYQGDAALSTWLHRVVVNACLMRRRANRRSRALEPLLATIDPALSALCDAATAVEATDRLCTEEIQRQVRAAIDLLPDSYRTVVMLRDIEGLDTDATADLLETSSACVKTRLHRARAALRTIIEPWVELQRA